MRSEETRRDKRREEIRLKKTKRVKRQDEMRQ